MEHKLPQLPYELDALSPHLSKETLEFHYGKHHQTYITNLNNQIKGTEFENLPLEEIVKKSEIINADGASVILASKYLGKPLPERVAGIDLMQDLLKLSCEKGYSAYFFGAKQEVVDKMLEKFKETYPNLNIVGARNGYFSDEELKSIEADIAEKNPDIVYIGITSPKKEYIVQEFLDNGLNSVFMGVGGSFDVLSGTIPRAPKWMQKANLEWLFRVANEPRRLFKRYFVGNVTFIKEIVKEKRSQNG